MKFFSFKWFFIISCCGQLTVIATFVKLMIMIEIIKNDVIIIIIIMIIVMIIIMIITIIMIIMTTIIMMIKILIIKAIMILIVKLYHREHAPK